jgi:hypothetical protein
MDRIGELSDNSSGSFHYIAGFFYFNFSPGDGWRVGNKSSPDDLQHVNMAPVNKKNRKATGEEK